MVDPEQYRGRSVLVVGGGDSALEAAAEIAEQPGTTVTLSYRSPAFSRAKAKNRERVEANAGGGRLSLMLSSQVREIGESHVVVEMDGQPHRIENDAVIVCAGGVLPAGFLRDSGIEVETKHGTA